ncbi:copper resistance protein B [Sphingobium faniae]|jgi:copper resistance protein B|nr:copper resistance protein B [Alphaproteobacteria bacterium]MBU0793052.1 copper resistance protein B [Alphaproteobacteria bacterium]MBU0877660.1 copper resistance protein B [Alphaproteobacteria bacterium]MBU1770172.1 copper resistance protein B [Alphaproteobacteria bacterium]SCW89439.1 copper resistance protein B [Sphingobium faniae]|tara:strand:- start:46884 stop:47924 length:1041 start_codon:yes stop_codon:yes gene_type:complete
MTRILILLTATALASPALAQTSDHGHATPSAAETQPATPVDPHAGHASASEPAVDPHAGHMMQPTQEASDPHAGHSMPASGANAGHTAPGHEPGIPDPPVGPPPSGAFSSPHNAADAVFGTGAMADAREISRREHGDITTYNILIDQMESRVTKGRDGYFVSAQGWYGGDIDRLWLKTEIESDFREKPEQAEVQALWSHALDPWFNLQTGIRYDFEPSPERAHLVVGIQGLAPYWFEVDGALFLSDKGDLTARFEAEYDQRITQRLILQPRVEIDFALQDVPEIGVGSGLSKAEVGLRLRYEIVKEFAPYIGVEYNETFGDTAAFERAVGGDVSHLSFVFGVRAWF